MPGVEGAFISIGGIVIIESFEDQFTGMTWMLIQVISDLDEFIQGRVIMYDTTVPYGFSIEKNNEAIVHMFYVDPVFLFHVCKY
jgi:hypothetical protein